MRALIYLAAAMLTACATAPAVVDTPEGLLHDALFSAPSERIRAADAFAVSEPMRRFLKDEVATEIRQHGYQLGLAEALQKPAKLKLEYDAAVTRNASEAFDARAGNCLSLVLMTAAFAKELGLPVRYQSAYQEETWNRSGDLLVRSGHINITLGGRLFDSGSMRWLNPLTIDFLPASEIRGMRVREIDESTVVAMYMNNRAVEALAKGRTADAYAWVREAIRQDPGLTIALNTLGVVYLRHGALAPAERTFAYMLKREPKNTQALANLADVYARQGRTAEADALRTRLAQLEPYPPFHFFHLGQAAMKRGDFRAARDLFAREVARADYNAEFHYWLALANFQLGDYAAARRQLAQARDNSASRQDRDLYAAKLAWLRGRAAN